MNSEAFLSFNPPLGLKQEIPSPQTPSSKLSNKSPQGHIIGSPDNGQNKNDQQDHNIPLNSPPQNKRYDGEKESGAVGGGGGAFQQLLPSSAAAAGTENTSGKFCMCVGEYLYKNSNQRFLFSTLSVQNSPRPIPESSAKSDLPADDFK